MADQEGRVVPDWIFSLDAPGITHLDKWVLAAINWRQGPKPWAWPSHEKIASDIVASERGVRKSIRRLERSGVLVVDRSSPSGNRYSVKERCSPLNGVPRGIPFPHSGTPFPPTPAFCSPEGGQSVPPEPIKGTQKDEPIHSSCAEPEKSPAHTPSGIRIPLNGKQQIKEYEFSLEQIAEWKTAYPAVDVPAQLRKMRAWALSNPAKKKTLRGISRFANQWLAKEQDRPHQANGSGSAEESLERLRIALAPEE